MSSRIHCNDEVGSQRYWKQHKILETQLNAGYFTRISEQFSKLIASVVKECPAIWHLVWLIKA